MVSFRNHMRLKIDEVTATPSHDNMYELYCKRYWIVDADNNIMFHKRSGIPMCNSKEQLVASLIDSFDEPVTVQYLERVWLSHDCSDYV